MEDGARLAPGAHRIGVSASALERPHSEKPAPRAAQASVRGLSYPQLLLAMLWTSCRLAA
jgi:hypothetical protein